MRPVAPRTGHPEVTYAENQLEYLPVTVAVIKHSTGDRSLLTRWTLTPAEREKVAKGEDIYVSQSNFGQPMTPMNVYCGPGPFAWCSCAAATPDARRELCSVCGGTLSEEQPR